jgi:hypothetical protein
MSPARQTDSNNVLQRPVEMATQSRHSSLCEIMSAFGGKADIVGVRNQCPLMTQSGHSSEIPAKRKPLNKEIIRFLLPYRIKLAPSATTHH